VVATRVEALIDLPGDADAADEALAKVSTDESLALLASLPRREAEAIILRVVIGLDAADAARILGTRAGAVRSAAYRGLRRLAKRIESSTEPGADPVLSFAGPRHPSTEPAAAPTRWCPGTSPPPAASRRSPR
jgi:RNA polymerase sigma-70 factor, ECF subfamily